MAPDPVELPHRGRARMVVAPESIEGTSARCVARVPADHPCVVDGEAPAPVLLELGAQAAAAIARDGGRPGRVVALKSLTWAAATIPAGVDLVVSVELVDAAPPLRNYAIEVEGLGRGVVSVWLDEASDG